MARTYKKYAVIVQSEIIFEGRFSEADNVYRSLIKVFSMFPDQFPCKPIFALSFS